MAKGWKTKKDTALDIRFEEFREMYLVDLPEWQQEAIRRYAKGEQIIMLMPNGTGRRRLQLLAKAFVEGVNRG